MLFVRKCSSVYEWFFIHVCECMRLNVGIVSAEVSFSYTLYSHMDYFFFFSFSEAPR